jgi:hypothetical protein
MKSNNKFLSIMYKIAGVIMIGIIIFQLILRNIGVILADIVYNTITISGCINSILQIFGIPVFWLAGITMWRLGIEMTKEPKYNIKRSKDPY